MTTWWLYVTGSVLSSPLPIRSIDTYLFKPHTRPISRHFKMKRSHRMFLRANHRISARPCYAARDQFFSPDIIVHCCRSLLFIRQQTHRCYYRFFGFCPIVAYLLAFFIFRGSLLSCRPGTAPLVLGRRESVAVDNVELRTGPTVEGIRQQRSFA